MSIIDYFVGIELSHGLAARAKEEDFVIALFYHDKQSWINWRHSHPEIDFDAMDCNGAPISALELWVAFNYWKDRFQ